MNLRHNHSGFSLVEIMIAAGILGILAMISTQSFINSNKGASNASQKADLIDEHLLLTQLIVNKGSEICAGLSLKDPNLIPTPEQLKAYSEANKVDREKALTEKDPAALMFRDRNPVDISPLNEVFHNVPGKPGKNALLDANDFRCDETSNPIICKSQFVVQSKSEFGFLKDLKFPITIKGNKDGRKITGCEFPLAGGAIVEACTALGGEWINNTCKRKSEDCGSGKYLRGYNDQGPICETAAKGSSNSTNAIYTGVTTVMMMNYQAHSSIVPVTLPHACNVPFRVTVRPFLDSVACAPGSPQGSWDLIAYARSVTKTGFEVFTSTMCPSYQASGAMDVEWIAVCDQNSAPPAQGVALYSHVKQDPLMAWSSDGLQHYINCSNTDAAAYCATRGAVFIEKTCKPSGGNMSLGYNYNSGEWSSEGIRPNVLKSVTCANGTPAGLPNDS